MLERNPDLRRTMQRIIRGLPELFQRRATVRRRASVRGHHDLPRTLHDRGRLCGPDNGLQCGRLVVHAQLHVRRWRALPDGRHRCWRLPGRIWLRGWCVLQDALHREHRLQRRDICVLFGRGLRAR